MAEKSSSPNLDTTVNTFEEIFANIEPLKKTLNNLFSSAIKKMLEMEGEESTWSYNESGDEEEEYGFKKAYFYNNDNFYSENRKTNSD